MPQPLTQDFVAHFRGEPDAELWSSFSRIDLNLISQSAKEILAGVPPLFGSCAMLSATWVTYLRERHNIPAVAVAGDLVLDNVSVFFVIETSRMVRASAFKTQASGTDIAGLRLGGMLVIFLFFVRHTP